MNIKIDKDEQFSGKGRAGSRQLLLQVIYPVSYTHLTLPTKA